MSKDLTEALRAMMEEPKDTNVVPARKPRGEAPKSTSAALLAGGGAGSGAGDLTEPSYADREYYATGFRSTDGLFVLPAIKKVVMNDGAGRVVNLTFAAAPPP